MAEEAKESKQSRRKGRPRSHGEPEHEDYVSGEEALEKGYTGAKEKKEGAYDNEEYALTSGPDSPPYPLDESKR